MSKPLAWRAFGKKHFDSEMQGKYEEFMKRSGFPTRSITKDVDYIRAKLKRRQKITFTTGVMITVPADQVQLVSIQRAMEDGNTIVKIKGAVESND